MEYSIYLSSQLLGVFETIEAAYDFCRKLDDAIETGNNFYTILREPEKYRIKELNIEAEDYIWADLDTFLYLYETEELTDLSCFKTN